MSTFSSAQVSKNIFQERTGQNINEKKLIGWYVAYILRQEVAQRGVAIDGGSTNIHVINGICRDALAGRPTVSHVLTNHLEGIYLAKDIPDGFGPVWFCTGGLLRQSRGTFIDDTENPSMQIRCWAAVVGINGFEPLSLQTTTRTEHHVKQAMIEVARYIIFPIDSSKWGSPTGKELANLSSVVGNGKRVSLVTCLPVQEAMENNKKFLERKQQISVAMDSLISLWRCASKHKIEIFGAMVNNDFINVEEYQFMVQDGTVHEIMEYYQKAFSNGKATIIRFDLWEEKFAGSTEDDDCSGD